MKKIAFIVQQYGQEMYGGAELHCMRLAEKMTTLYDVEVLTTCSLDFLTWADHYPEGVTEINKVKVRRFKVSQLRNWDKMSALEKKIKVKKNATSGKIGTGSIFKKIISLLKNNTPIKEDYINWITAQGPATPGLINYIKTHEKDYDCLIFFSYLYYPTVFGIDTNPQKTIFIPLAHDEWAIYMPVFKPIFNIPACIMYNTKAEKRLVNKIFGNESVYSEIGGTWVDLPAVLEERDMKAELNIGCDYILYVGRIDDFKITDQDFQWFLKYAVEAKEEIKLILTGNLYRAIPKSDHIMYLGFVDEQMKFNLIKQSLFLFQPSRFESLSIVLLEAFAMERPVLVHKDCEVMKDHVNQSQGGFYYNDYPGFKEVVDKLIYNTSLNNEMGKAGKSYADKNYSSESIINKFQQVIEHIMPDKN